jgi:hypothetical protein
MFFSAELGLSNTLLPSTFTAFFWFTNLDCSIGFPFYRYNLCFRSFRNRNILGLTHGFPTRLGHQDNRLAHARRAEMMHGSMQVVQRKTHGSTMQVYEQISVDVVDPLYNIYKVYINVFSAQKISVDDVDLLCMIYRAYKKFLCV